MRSHAWLAALLSLCSVAEAKTVFAHYIISNTYDYAASDFENDINLAKQAHIDGFALNIARAQDVNGPSVASMFDAADSLGFSLFFSFDYSGNGAWAASDVLSYLQSYTSRGSYFKHTTGQPLVSTFEGYDNSGDWVSLKQQTNAFFAPDYSSHGAQGAYDTGVADGLFLWGGWPDGPNSITTVPDQDYINVLNGKPYIMPVSPWFYTNLPTYTKNWVWRGDSLWFDRWNQIFELQPEYVEIITWNDYGESHHIGPLIEYALAALQYGGAPFNYAEGRPHDGWRQFLPYLIDTYKNGGASIDTEILTSWYRLNHGTACNAGGTTGNSGPQNQQTDPNPGDYDTDQIFFEALLTSNIAPQVQIGSSGFQSASWSSTPSGGSGLYFGSFPMNGQSGNVTVQVGNLVVDGAAIDDSVECPNGLANWNPWVGFVTGTA